MSGMTKVLRPYLFDLVNWCEAFIHILKGFFVGTDEITRNPTTNQHNKAWVMFIILEICIVSQKGKWWLYLLYCSLKDGALSSKYSFQTHYTVKNAWELIVHRMTSWNGNIFCVTDLSWGESTSHRWVPLTKASDAELWWFLWSAPE